MREVGRKRGVEASGGNGERGSNSLESKRDCAMISLSLSTPSSPYVLLLPLRITVSRTATKSVMTASASCRPASTDMTSELGLVYFLVRAASRKTVKVWPVSLELYRMAAAGVPRARSRLRGASPASRPVWRGGPAAASATVSAAFRLAVWSRVCASSPRHLAGAGRTPAKSRRKALFPRRPPVRCVSESRSCVAMS
jgi:hypothetical protein